MQTDQIDIDAWLDEHYDDLTDEFGVDNDEEGDYDDQEV